MIKSLLMNIDLRHRPCLPASLALFLSILTFGCQPIQHTYHGSPYVEPKEASSFQLTKTNGEVISFPSDLPGISLLFFGYTHCPDVCPGTAAQVKLVFDKLGSNINRVNFVFVTVDPDRDSLDKIENFPRRFNPNFIGLRGELGELEQIKVDYGVFAEVDPDSSEENYLITHTARVFLIDDNGILRTGYPFDTPHEDILADVKYLLGKSQ
jgi:protein SCO1/2